MSEAIQRVENKAFYQHIIDQIIVALNQTKDWMNLKSRGMKSLVRFQQQ